MYNKKNKRQGDGEGITGGKRASRREGGIREVGRPLLCCPP